MAADTTSNNLKKKKKHKDNGFDLGESSHYFLFYQQISAKPQKSVPIEKEERVVTDGTHWRRKGHSCHRRCAGPCLRAIRRALSAPQTIPGPVPLPPQQRAGPRELQRIDQKVWAVLFISMDHKCWKLEMKNLTSDLSNISPLMGSF